MYEIFGIVKVKVYICDMIFMISRFTKSSLEVGRHPAPTSFLLNNLVFTLKVFTFVNIKPHYCSSYIRTKKYLPIDTVST